MKTTACVVPLALAGLAGGGSTLVAEEASQKILTALSSTTLSGYVDTSAIWKFGTGDQLVGRSYDGTAKQDGFNLDVVKLCLAKPLEESGWSAGYQVDLLFGPDAATYNSMLGASPSDVAIEQAHLKVQAPIGNGLFGTFGVFATPFGYEVFDSYKNPNYSRSHGYSISRRRLPSNTRFGPMSFRGLNSGGTMTARPGAEHQLPLEQTTRTHCRWR